MHGRKTLQTIYRMQRLEVVHSGHHHFAIVAIIRGEDPYLNDWINFHRSQGVSHFYIYDNAANETSAMGTFKLLKSDIEAKIVSYIRWPDAPNCRIGTVHNPDRTINSLQEIAYYDFGRRFRKQTEYYSKLDIDEFMFSRDGGTLCQHLNFRGSVKVAGYNFGSSGQTQKSTLPVWQRFHLRETSPSQMKSISRSKDVYEFFNAHIAMDRPLIYLSVNPNANKQLCEKICTLIKLHHYKLKSKAEYIDHRISGITSTGFNQGDYCMDDFMTLDEKMSAIRDESILKHNHSQNQRRQTDLAPIFRIHGALGICYATS